MKLSTTVAALMLCVIAAVPSGAQVGQPLPDTSKVGGFAQSPARSFDDYTGRLILVEFFEHGSDACKTAVEHLNELQDEFGASGLSVIGLTSEPAKPTDKFMKETNARYAYAYESSGKLMSALGADSFPSAALIDPSGTVVWTGIPSAIDSGLISKHIQGAFKKPTWEWPKSTKSLVKILKQKQFAKALAGLDKLAGTEDSIDEIRASVEAMIAARMSALESSYSEGNFLGALDLAEVLKKQMKGIKTNSDRVAEVKSLIKADKEAKRVIKLQQKLRELKAERLNSPADVTKLIEVVEQFKEKAAGTYASKEADAFIDKLRSMQQ
ncbi:MAG: peroxiredoxin [Planctomycetota bacterium]|jgi:peroxiredoxin